jgi:1-phosphatidylinositol phosphodiesterase
MRIPKQFHRPVITLLLLLCLSITAYAHEHGAYSHDPQPKTFNPDWMAEIKDDTLLSMLSIPGTHETMALYGVGGVLPPGVPVPPLIGQIVDDIVICQSMSLWDQLMSGVRVLDIRCRHLGLVKR